MSSNGSGWEVFTRISVNAGVLQSSILVPALFLLYINDLPNDVIRNIVYADTTLYFKLDQVSWSLATTRICFSTWI